MAFSSTFTGLDSHGVVVESPASPDFDVTARPLLGRAADIALKLKPFLALVSNHSPQTVMSFSKMWEIRYRDGQTRQSLSHTSFAEAVCGDTAISHHPAGLHQGETRIEADGIWIQGWGGADPYFDQFLSQFVTQRDAAVAAAASIDFRVCAVIFADGTLAGEDEGSWLRGNFSAYVTAKQHWSRGILAALDEGQPVDEAFGPVTRFVDERRLQLQKGEPDVFDRDPLDMWTQQAAADALRWRRRFSDDDVVRLLRESIRLEPFVIRPAH